MAKTVTGQALWEFCEDLLAKGAGYVWGGRGRVYDKKEAQSLFKTFGNGTYNEKYYMITSMERWGGKIVVDCSGMIQAFRIAKFDGVDRSANGLYTDECPADRKGTIDTLPRNLRGVLLFKQSGNKMSHVGVYGGDGTTIESYGSTKGVIKRDPMKESSWTHWGIPYWLEPTVIGGTSEAPKTEEKKEETKPKEETKTPAKTPSNNTSTPLKVCKVDKCFKLNVRKGAGVSHASIAVLRKGVIVEVFAIKGNWAKIDKDEEKWCSTKYLVELDKYEITGCSHLNVRKGPGVNYKVVKCLDKGDIVYEYGIAKNGWIQIGADLFISYKYAKKIK